jgi:hypothetical protein
MGSFECCCNTDLYRYDADIYHWDGPLHNTAHCSGDDEDWAANHFCGDMDYTGFSWAGCNTVHWYDEPGVPYMAMLVCILLGLLLALLWCCLSDLRIWYNRRGGYEKIDPTQVERQLVSSRLPTSTHYRDISSQPEQVVHLQRLVSPHDAIPV